MYRKSGGGEPPSQGTSVIGTGDCLVCWGQAQGGTCHQIDRRRFQEGKCTTDPPQIVNSHGFASLSFCPSSCFEGMCVRRDVRNERGLEDELPVPRGSGTSTLPMRHTVTLTEFNPCACGHRLRACCIYRFRWHHTGPTGQSLPDSHPRIQRQVVALTLEPVLRQRRSMCSERPTGFRKPHVHAWLNADCCSPKPNIHTDHLASCINYP